jgi:large subunit ribosomal protein L19
MADLMKFVKDEFVTRKDFPDFGAGDTITVFYEIKEGEKTRTQRSSYSKKRFWKHRNFYYS